MKNIKRLSLMLAIAMIISVAFSVASFAEGNTKEIEENNKIYATIPADYELNVYGDDLAYSLENGNYIEFCVDENKFAPEGITALNESQVEKVFEHYYLNEGDLENLNEYVVKCDKVEKTTVNGYNCYYLTGAYAFSEGEIDSAFAYYFHAAMFATKEDIFTIVFESYEKTPKLSETALPEVISGIVFNGTHFENDKPEANADHDFSASPAYDEAIAAVQGDFFEDVMQDETVVLGTIAGILLVTVLPTLIVVIFAIAFIVKYVKNKKKLKKYEMAYGSVPAYNTVQPNYGGYGYQPVNQPYQPTVNSAYQNLPQTPSYITNALNNLRSQAEQQPQQLQQAEAESQTNQ